MKTLKLTIAIGATLLLCSAHAETIRIDVPSAEPPSLALTRAEVLADLHIWRLSGLAEFTRGERPQIYGGLYLQAKARYDAMRDSPAYRDLVEKMSKTPNATVRGR